MRTLLGVGTPKQWMAGAYNLLEAVTAFTFARQLCGFVAFTPTPGLSSLSFLIPSESQPLHETTRFFNSLLEGWASSIHLTGSMRPPRNRLFPHRNGAW